MLFHLGTLWRLNEAGYLPRLDRVSSVSGGSIAAGVLALSWPSLQFDTAGRATNLDSALVSPLRAFALRTVDIPAVLVGLLTPRLTINQVLAGRYRRLFGAHTLADLTHGPEFVFDATSLQSGDLWRFSSRTEGDWRVGVRGAPDTKLTRVVAASSAFPPFLSPARLRFPVGALRPGADPEVNHPPYTTRPTLTDGGVYDNLGLEAVWSRYEQVLISDAGGHIGNVARPHGLWPLQVYRVLGVIDNQVRDLRKRQAVQAFIDGRRTGAYWGIRSHVRDFGLADPVAEPTDAEVKRLAGIPTRLARVAPALQEQLINWGYVICDTAMRAHFDPGQPRGALPYPQTGL